MTFPLNSFLSGGLLALLISIGMPVQAASEGKSAAPASDEQSDTKSGEEQADANRISREGVVVEFSTRPTEGESDQVIAADWAGPAGAQASSQPDTLLRCVCPEQQTSCGGDPGQAGEGE